MKIKLYLKENQRYVTVDGEKFDEGDLKNLHGKYEKSKKDMKILIELRKILKPMLKKTTRETDILEKKYRIESKKQLALIEKKYGKSYKKKYSEFERLKTMLDAVERGWG